MILSDICCDCGNKSEYAVILVACLAGYFFCDLGDIFADTCFIVQAGILPYVRIMDGRVSAIRNPLTVGIAVPFFMLKNPCRSRL